MLMRVPAAADRGKEDVLAGDEVAMMRVERRKILGHCCLSSARTLVPAGRCGHPAIGRQVQLSDAAALNCL